MSTIHDVFLSYNNKDKTFVLELAKALKGKGIEPWLDEWELVPGRPWQQSLEQIIEHTRAVAILIGDEGFGPWELIETRALLVQFVERGLPVIPVLLPRKKMKLELPIFLSAFTWVDLHDGITPEGLNRLIWGITGTKSSFPIRESEAHLAGTKSTIQDNKIKIFSDQLQSNESLINETDPSILLAASRHIQRENKVLFLRRRIESDLSLYNRLEKVEECLFEKYLERMAANCTLYEAVSHFHKLETYISKLSTPELKDSFTPCEAFILLASIYLKDIGLARCFSDIYKYPLDDHHIVGYELFLESYSEFGLNKELALTIAPLIRAHRVIPIGELSLETAFDDEIIRTRLLCALLRLGDFLDFPSGKMSMTALNVGAIIKYAAVTGIQINQPSWRIKISGTASSLQESEFLLNLWFNLQNVLDSVRETLEKYGLHYQVMEVDSNALRPYFVSRNITRELQRQFLDSNIGKLSENDFYSYVIRTPVLSSKVIDLEIGGSVSFKCESFQETGSFKFRGAISLLANASEEEKEYGVFSASSGNFAIALITACKAFNVRITHILMPLSGNKEKVEFIKKFSNAEVIFYETEEEKQSSINLISSKYSSIFVSATDKRAQQGYETIVKELYYNNDYDVLMIPVGEGALLSACASVSRRINPHVRIIGCEPAARNDAYKSFQQCDLVSGADSKTIADGLMAKLTTSTFTTIIENVDDILTVEEKEIEDGVNYLLEKLALSVEPSAAVAVAAMLRNKKRFYNKRICVLLTGRNHKNIQASKFLMSP